MEEATLDPIQKYGLNLPTVVYGQQFTEAPAQQRRTERSNERTVNKPCTREKHRGRSRNLT